MGRQILEQGGAEMKVACYNACSVCFSDLEYGDAFYQTDTLYMKVFDPKESDPDKGVAVRLDTGRLEYFSVTDMVTKAEVKVIADI